MPTAHKSASSPLACATLTVRALLVKNPAHGSGKDACLYWVYPVASAETSCDRDHRSSVKTPLTHTTEKSDSASVLPTPSHKPQTNSPGVRAGVSSETNGGGKTSEEHPTGPQGRFWNSLWRTSIFQFALAAKPLSCHTTSSSEAHFRGTVRPSHPALCVLQKSHYAQ